MSIVMRMQIGPIKYSKDEEALLGRAFAVGLLVGVPVGLFVNFILGFPMFPRQMPVDFLDWFFTGVKLLGSLVGFWWILSTVLSLVFYHRSKKLVSSWQKGLRAMFAMMLIPFIVLYVAFVFSIISVPVNLFLLPLVPSPLIRALSYLLFLPFVIFFVAVLLPETYVGRRLRRFLHRLKRRSAEKVV
jgi:hypothetical protein